VARTINAKATLSAPLSQLEGASWGPLLFSENLKLITEYLELHPRVPPSSSTQRQRRETR